MLPVCKKCKDCHSDLTISKALGTLEMTLMSETNRFDSEDQVEICWLHRKMQHFSLLLTR